MAKTLGVLITITTYGQWLRGDQRGWVDEGKILPPDPQLHAADAKRLKHPPLRFDDDQQHAVGHAITKAVRERLGCPLYALAVESWHTHVVLGPMNAPIGRGVKVIKDAARWELRLDRPLWAEGYDKRWCFDETTLRNRIDYVHRHNLRRQRI